MASNDQPISRGADRLGEILHRYAQQAEDSMSGLAHLGMAEPSLSPAEVEVVLGHLAETMATVPQVAAQLGRVLNRSKDTRQLAMDGMTSTTDPNLAVDIARHHLDEVRDPAVQTYRHLNAARDEVAHISATPLEETLDAHGGALRPRAEDRRPPSAPSPGRNGPAR